MNAPCSSRKIGYPTRMEAQTQLNRCRLKALMDGEWARRRKESDLYQCPICGNWHLTSMRASSALESAR